MNTHFIFRFILTASFIFCVSATNAKNKSEGDNTRLNREKTLTAEDQIKGSRSDVEITRRIRSDLVEDDSLSVYGQNIKIITLNGVVTLTGPVKSAEEKAKIENYARRFVSKKNIRNQLEISSIESSAR